MPITMGPAFILILVAPAAFAGETPAPGTHSLQLLLGDWSHIPIDAQ